MEIGISSACLYPLETEKSFLRMAELGFENCEIFFNSASELNRSFVKELCAIKDTHNINVTSLHPYASFAEGYEFFSKYKRRFYDAVESYKRYFEAASELGASFIVLHGSKNRIEIPLEEYAERYNKLNETALSLGCTVAHENVVNFSGAKPEFAATMKGFLGNSFKMVLDVKQARRAGVNYSDFIDIMGKSIVHVHLSDFNESCDCLPPCEKNLFNFEQLFTSLSEKGYNGRYIIELYSDNYKEESELIKSAKYLEGILNKVRQG